MRRAVLFALLTVPVVAPAQLVLKDHPRYARYQKAMRENASLLVSGVTSGFWSEDSKTYNYAFGGKNFQFDVKTAKTTEVDALPPRPTPPGRGRSGPSRGRQADTAVSPDGKRTAVSRDRNVYATIDGTEIPVTLDGNETSRVKYGVASWVYGEELGVQEAMWWSPDGKKLAFYKFDEKQVKDYYLAVDQKAYQSKLYPEAYPKAGASNPSVDLRVWDSETKRTTVFPTSAPWDYIYDVRWSPNGKELLFARTDRKQKTMQLVACNPESQGERVVAEETQPQSWAENHPTIRFLADQHRFIWSTEKNGYANYELRDLSGKLLNPITSGNVDVTSIVRIDEKAKELFYLSAGPENPYHQQLHVVGLDGKNDRLLTDPALHHAPVLSPDGKTFVDVVQSASMAPETRVVTRAGKVLATLAKTDRTKFDAAGLKPTEVFTYLAADGKTTLYGTVQVPSDFDPTKKYPVLLSVYAGPESGGIRPGFSAPSAMTELGFICVNLAGRGTMGRGKAFRDAVYGKLGIVEMDDQAAGIQALAKRPYVDGSRVGVHGTSYGGYSTILLLLRHPETFAVGCASSSVTDWRNYDSIYTERFMGLPWDNENKAGYDAGSAIKLAGGLKGKLMLYFGSSDDNVHPSNTYQLVEALEKVGKEYDLQVGPDQGHTGMNLTRMLEYFLFYLKA